MSAENQMESNGTVASMTSFARKFSNVVHWNDMWWRNTGCRAWTAHRWWQMMTWFTFRWFMRPYIINIIIIIIVFIRRRSAEIACIRFRIRTNSMHFTFHKFRQRNNKTKRKPNGNRLNGFVWMRSSHLNKFIWLSSAFEETNDDEQRNQM